MVKKDILWNCFCDPEISVSVAGVYCSTLPRVKSMSSENGEWGTFLCY